MDIVINNYKVQSENTLDITVYSLLIFFFMVSPPTLCGLLSTIRTAWIYQREVIRISKSKNRQQNGRKKTNKRTNKTKDRVTWTPLKTWTGLHKPQLNWHLNLTKICATQYRGELMCSGGVSSSWPTNIYM